MNLLNLYSKEIGNLPENNYFKSCGISVCDNERDDYNLLITGCNPGISEETAGWGDFAYTNPFVGNPIAYFAKLCKFVPELEREKIAYMDIFPFKEKNEATLLAKIVGQEAFMARILAITEAEIERINPSLLVIANKGTYPYWGAVSDCIWMGYDFQQIEEQDLPETLRGRELDIRIIKGFRQGTFAERDIIYRPENGICQLRGTVVVMSKFSRNVSVLQQLTIDDYHALMAFSRPVKSASKYL